MCATLVDARQFRQFAGLHSFDRSVPCRKLGSKEIHMSTIATVRSGFYHVPLPIALTDSTHGEMKDGRPKLSEDVARVQGMRKHLGPDFPLMVDANMRWTVDLAIQAARALQPYNLVWLEEPTIPDDIYGHARIVREGGVPIATGENFHTLHEFAHFMRAEALTYPEPDVTNCGGVTVFMKVAHLAESFNLLLTSHGAQDTTAHLLAAAPNRSYLEAHGFGLERYLAHPLQIVDGNAIAPDRPGHGIEFDWKGLETLSV